MPGARQPEARNQCCGCCARTLRIAQRLQRLKWRLAEKAAPFALTVLAVVGEVEEADAIRAAGIGEVRGGVQVLAGGAAEGEDVVACCELVAIPDRVAELEVERRALRSARGWRQGRAAAW